MLKMIQSRQTMTPISRFAKLFFLFCYFTSCNNAERTDYVFPDNYKGWAIVVFNVKNEKECEMKEGRMQIEIPQNGILFTSCARPEGILDNRYFSKNGVGSYAKIYPSYNSISRLDTLSSYVLVESYHSLKLNESDYLNKSTTESPDKWIIYDEIIIFKIATGFSDTTASKKDVDGFLESVKALLIEKGAE